MSKAKALELKPKLQKLPKHWPENENRVLIREGVLFIEEESKVKPRWCFLFNDCFLECKPACDFAENNTRLQDPSTPFRFKNYMLLNTCYLDENPSTIKKQVHKLEQHKTSPFVLIGHNLEEKIRNKKSEISLIYSSSDINDRTLWCSDIHSSICNIYLSINNDLMNYGWQNQYRKGTVFHAVYTLHNELVKQIGVDADIKDIGGHNLLHLACAVNNVDFIEDYGNKFDIDAVDCNGWSGLRIASDNDNIESVRVLCDTLYPNLDEYYPADKSINPYTHKQNEHDTNRYELDDRTILHELCSRGQSELVSIVLDTQSINMEALDANGATPLHIAARKNEEACVLLLLQNGAPPNLADFKGNRTLHNTTKEMCARWLIAYGARLELCNKWKKSCADAWGNKLDKYVPLLQHVTATDCRIQDNIAENTAWFDDKLSNACLLCGNLFTIWSRRHHCRACGLLICQSCSLRKLQFNKDGKPTLERACDKCFNKNHSKLLREKKYVFRGKLYHMKARDFYKMCVMETSMKGSYHIWIKSLEEKEENNDLLMVGLDGDDEKKENVNAALLNSKSKSSPGGEGEAVDKKGHHQFSASVGIPSLFNRNKKKDEERYIKHQSAQSQAMNQTQEALNKVHERGQKLSQLADKSDQMADNAKNFNDLAKQLANKKW